MSGSGFAEFDRLTELFVRARDVLARVVREHDLPRESSDFLAASVLPHVELVEEGFRFSLRASGVDLAELRWFVLAAGVGQPLSDEPAARRAARAEERVERDVRPPAVKQPNGGELAAIQHAVAALPARQRIVITLRDVEGYDSEEVCALLEISAANQRVLLHRARAAVRLRLEDYFAGEVPAGART